MRVRKKTSQREDGEATWMTSRTRGGHCSHPHALDYHIFKPRHQREREWGDEWGSAKVQMIAILHTQHSLGADLPSFNVNRLVTMWIQPELIGPGSLLGRRLWNSHLALALHCVPFGLRMQRDSRGNRYACSGSQSNWALFSMIREGWDSYAWTYPVGYLQPV